MHYRSSAEIHSPGTVLSPSQSSMGIGDTYKGWQGWCVLVCGLLLVAACGKGKSALPLPMANPISSTKPKMIPAELPEYRAQGGLPFAPTILGDTPGAVARPVTRPSRDAQPPVNTLNGDPKGLMQKDLNLAMLGSTRRMSSCFSPGTPNPKFNLSFEAEPSGRVSLLRLKGAPPDAEPCIRQAVQEMRFPTFEGKAVPVEMPIVFHEVAHKGVIPSAKTKEPVVTPLFVQP